LESLQSILTVLFTLAMLIAVLFLAYFTTRWLGQKSMVGHGSKNIKIIDRFNLAQDKNLVIVQVAGECMLLGITNQSIQRISSIEESSLQIGQPGEENTFSSIFATAIKEKIRVDPWHKKDQGAFDE